MKPGLKEHALVSVVVQLIVGYCGRSVDQMPIVRALTGRGMPLAQFKPTNFLVRVDVNCLIA